MLYEERVFLLLFKTFILLNILNIFSLLIHFCNGQHCTSLLLQLKNSVELCGVSDAVDLSTRGRKRKNCWSVECFESLKETGRLRA